MDIIFYEFATFGAHSKVLRVASNRRNLKFLSSFPERQIQMQDDNTATIQLVDHLRAESAIYFRQYTLWLGVGSGGAILAVLALSSNLQDPEAAIHFFLPSLWLFLLGVIAAGLSLLLRSASVSSAGTHFAEAHNRGEYSAVAKRMPEVFSSPRRIADEANRERNYVVDRANKAHALAERAWTRHRRYAVASYASTGCSAVAFVVGVAWPLVYLTLDGRMVAD